MKSKHATTQRRPTHASLLVPLLRQRDAWLRHAIETALGQTIACEVVVVTSPSTPPSNLQVLDELAARDPCLRIVVRPPGTRFAGALNLAIAHATHPRFGILLSDDWLDPGAVESCLRIEADIVSTAASVWAADGRTRLADLDRRRYRFELSRMPSRERTAQYLGHFLFLSRAAVLAAGGVDETVGDSPGVDDYHLLWTMLERGATAAVCERPLYNVRDHEGERLTNRGPLRMLETMARILAKHDLGPVEHEVLLAWHARWFGQPLGNCTTAASRAVTWARAEGALERARAAAADPRVLDCLGAIDGVATIDGHARRVAALGVAPESTALAALTEAMLGGLLVRSEPYGQLCG